MTTKTLSRDELRAGLAELERKHKLSSIDFYEDWRSGYLSEKDDPEFQHWAGLCYMALRLGGLIA